MINWGKKRVKSTTTNMGKNTRSQRIIKTLSINKEKSIINEEKS